MTVIGLGGVPRLAPLAAGVADNGTYANPPFTLPGGYSFSLVRKIFNALPGGYSRCGGCTASARERAPHAASAAPRATVSKPPRSARPRGALFPFSLRGLRCYFVNLVLFCGCGRRAPYPRLLFSFAGRIANCRAARGWPVGRHCDGQLVRTVTSSLPMASKW